MRTKKRILTFVLALSMAIQTIIPTMSFAKESSSYQKENMVKVGSLDASNLMPLNGKTMQQINRLTKNAQDGQPIEKGTQLFSKPWFPNQRDPEDKDKPLYFGKVYVNLKTKGLTQQDGTELPFDWEGVFGRDEYGELNKVKVIFVQLNYKEGSFSTETGIKGILETNSKGKYYWADENGNPIKLPLYSKDFKPYKYEVYIEKSNSERVNLILDGSFGTPNFTFAKPDPKTGEIVADVFMDNTLIQIASTKFVSEWNTDTIEDDRPVVEFSYNTHNKNKDGEEIEGYFEFPKNNKDIEIIRDDNREDGKYSSSLLEKVPTVDVADPDPESNDTYTLDRDNNRISYKGKTYNYTFNYDVINGGKLTMTEVLTLKFDANSGKFDSIQQDQEQVKEHEVIYTKDLTDTIEEPKKDRETFLGWGIKDEKNNFIKDKRGNILLVDESAFKNIKESQTYYAVWDKHPISADQLEVKESFKDGDTWVNDFIPELAKLKEQVKIKDANGVPQALTDDDTLQILDDSGNPIADKDLKDKLYEKLKEDPATEVSRLVTLKAKVTHKNGTSQTVDIPIKVIKNIYEAKTEEGKPTYVPEKYVKVTVDPTTKAEKPQKYFYYVNPDAQVVIPKKENPKGTANNQFTKWLIKGTTEEYKLSEKPRHKFTGKTTIEAQYVSDVIPAKDNGDKPEGTPDNFVKVTFVPTEKGTLEGNNIFYVNPDKEVTIPVNNPIGVQDYTFKEWRMGEDASGASYAPTTAKQFKEATTINATYGYYPDVIPKLNDQGEENKIPEGYIEVIFKTTDKGGNVEKTVYVNPDRAVVLEGHAPKVTAITGYEFARWDTSINQAIKYRNKTVIIALYNDLGNISPKEIKGYVKVEFKKGSHGQLQGMTDYWIRPGVEINLIQPIAQADNGYSFDKWDKPLTLQAKAGDPTYVITALYKAREESGGSWQTGTLGPTRTVTVVEKEIVKVPAEKTFRKEVRYMQGYNNYFRPGAGLTRAEAAQILANALVEDGYRYDPNFAIHYKDIVGNEWYAKAIRITSQANVFKGYDTGYFDPHKKITRAEWIGTLRRFQELERVSGNHMQVRADHWAMGEIEAAYKEGWLAIYGQGLAKFKADEFIPRQEVAAVSNKAFKRVLDKTYIHRNSKNLINYKDVNPSMWSYEDILCASNGFIHDGKSFWGHKVDYKKDLYNLNLDGYTVTKDKFQRLERR